MSALSEMKILVTEDERPVRMLLRVVLEGAGATVVEADNGATALRLLELEHEGYDLVLTDLNMPQVDGGELVRQIRLQWGPSLPVVLCTAMNLEMRTPELRSLVQGVVTKPFSPPDLVRTCADAARLGRGAAGRAAV